MNWAAVRRHNARASQRKAKGERLKAERMARIDAAGGPIRVDELRSAVVTVHAPAPGHGHERIVHTIRGKDWHICGQGGVYSAYPFYEWRQDPDLREAVPLTTGASKWMAKEVGSE